MATVARFRIRGLPLEPFEPLFTLEDAELARRGVRRLVADHRPGFPCRVSLVDAEVGESVLLLPFEHHAADSPYRASGPIFVRENARPAKPGENELPEVVRERLLSVRAYDAAGTMLDADVTHGRELEALIGRFFDNPGVAYLHVHNARPGCYSCRVDRV